MLLLLIPNAAADDANVSLWDFQFRTLTRLAEVLAKKSTAEEACQALYDDWVKITDEYGKEDQKRFYRESLGL